MYVPFLRLNFNFLFPFQRELGLRDSDYRKQLEEKDDETRLAREENELRIASLSSKEGSKTQLMQGR
jgi:hypothetical protein